MTTATLTYGQKRHSEAESPWLASLRRAFFCRGSRVPLPREAWEMDQTGQRDLAAIVAHYAPMVKRVAMQLATRVPANVTLDDLIQSGMMGLIEAAQRYEVQDDAQFETYAAARVRGAMLDALRDDDWVPRSVRQELRQIEQAVAELQHRLGRHPTDSEVAATLGWSLERYFEVLSAGCGQRIVSYEDLISEDGGSEGFLERHLGDEEGDPAHCLEHRELQRQLADGIAQLPEKEQLVMALYYEHDLNYKEIAAVLEVSESRVAQLHASAITRLRAALSLQPMPRRRGRPRKSSPSITETPNPEEGC